MGEPVGVWAAAARRPRCPGGHWAVLSSSQVKTCAWLGNVGSPAAGQELRYSLTGCMKEAGQQGPGACVPQGHGQTERRVKGGDRPGGGRNVLEA